jgi:uncharacterized LabA/DUF88 family protein
VATTKPVCRIGVFYDGSYVSKAVKFFLHEEDAGSLRFRPFHEYIEQRVRPHEPGYSRHRVVYAAWFQGMFATADSNPDQLRETRDQHLDLMHAGIEAKFLPMSQGEKKEKGVDVALAVDALQAGLEDKIDVAALVTGDGDFVPLVRALQKAGVATTAVSFTFEGKVNKGYINPRLVKAADYTLDVTGRTQHQHRSLFGRALEGPETGGGGW